LSIAREINASGEWKPKARRGDQADLGVDRFHSGVGEAVADRRDDPLSLLCDRARELDERCQATAPRPGQPLIQQADRLTAAMRFSP
jgi:hypothetical protein